MNIYLQINNLRIKKATQLSRLFVSFKTQIVELIDLVVQEQYDYQ